MQAGADEWEAAGYLGMFVEVLREVYRHHHPDYMKSAIEGITAKRSAKPKQPQSATGRSRRKQRRKL